MADGVDSSFPIPNVTEEDRFFWEGVQDGKFLIQKCLDCSHLQFFPRPRCVSCFSSNLGWLQSAGDGVVYSFTVVRMPLHPAVRKNAEQSGEFPIFAKINLAEGVRVISEIIGSRPEEVKLGARVKLSFEKARGTDFMLPKFRLIKS